MALVLTPICDYGDKHDRRPATTIEFGIDGKEYEAEFCNEDEVRFRSMVGVYLPHARKATAATKKRRTDDDRRFSKEARAWGIANDLIDEDDTHGRLPDSVTRGYKEYLASLRG